MTIAINIINPVNGARQVSPTTHLSFTIDGYGADGYGVDVTTLNVQVNGVNAILNGGEQTISALLATDITIPTRFITLQTIPMFQLGETVEIYDNNSTQVVTTIILSINVNTNVVQLQDAVDNLTVAASAQIVSISRGFECNIALPQVTVYPLQPFAQNAIVLVAVNVATLNPLPTIADFVRATFAFRTIDTTPPQLLDFPSIIMNSVLSFRIVDILYNMLPLNSINVSYGPNIAIQDGYVTNHFAGSLTPLNDSEVSIYLQPNLPFPDGYVPVLISAIDGYGNKATYTKTVINNVMKLPEVEFISIFPIENTIIDPQDAAFSIHLRSNQPINSQWVNADLILDGYDYPIIKTGKFQACAGCNPPALESGTISIAEDIFIQLNAIQTIAAQSAYNDTFILALSLIQTTPAGDIPEGAIPFYERSFAYSTVSAVLPPVIDTFSPSTGAIGSNTPISFRLLSKTQNDPINLNSIIVSVNNIVAINSGLFSSNFTGTITAIQASAGNTVNVVLNTPTSYVVGSTVTVGITVADEANNTSTATFTFQIADTSTPTVTVTPPGGSFQALTRLTLTANQAATIYYTVDGSRPAIGALTTYAATSPVSNVPIYVNGITQVNAFAVGVNGLSGPLTTEIYDLNPYAPQVTIVSPANDTILAEGVARITYSVAVSRGYLAEVDILVNNGFIVNTQDTLLTSSVLVTGLTFGTNTIQVIATDSYGNKGSATLTVLVSPSEIIQFSIDYAPLVCPTFTNKTAPVYQSFADILDTATVAIIGLGQRLETVIDYALGNGVDGSPVDFNPANQPDGRHFELTTFPVVASSIQVYLYRHYITILLDASTYAFNALSGEIVLDHPLDRGESLTVQYIAEPDINAPSMYTPDQTAALYTRFGNPSPDNTLSLAAQLAFANGAPRILAVQAMNPQQDPTWTNSFSVLEQVEAYWLVPVLADYHLSFYPGIIAAGYAHTTLMSSILYGKERILATWYGANITNTFNDPRVFLVDLDLDPTVTAIIQNSATEINGTFVTASVAGTAAGLSPIPLPLTNKLISGFTFSITQKSPVLTANTLVAQGLMVLQATAAGAIVYRGRTSYNGITNPVLEELSIQRSVDYISKNVRALLTQYIGTLITADLLSRMQIATNLYLAAKTDVIASGSVTSIVVDSIEPRQVNIAISINPLYPLNQFSITINLPVTL